MDVYFDENFWGCQDRRHKGEPGEVIHVEEQFLWEGREVRIPAIYVCEEGLAVDFVTCIPVEEIERFVQKWKPRLEELTEEEEEEAGRENPMSRDMNAFLLINGEPAEMQSGCGASWIPPYLRGDEATKKEDAEELLMEAYGCDCRAGWSFYRWSYRWPDGNRVPLRNLHFTFEKEPVDHAGPHFTTRLGEEKKQVEFLHPVSEKKHVLTVESQEQTVLPARDMSELNRRGMGFKKFPTHFLAMEYTVEPELPEGELWLCDCAESDPPVMMRKKAGAVSSIGGADGPTSIFFAGKHKREKRNWQSVCSSVHYEPVDEVEWRMRFCVKCGKKKEIEIVL